MLSYEVSQFRFSESGELLCIGPAFQFFRNAFLLHNLFHEEIPAFQTLLIQICEIRPELTTQCQIGIQATLVIFQIVSVKTSIKTNLSFLFGYCDQWQIDFPDKDIIQTITVIVNDSF